MIYGAKNKQGLSYPQSMKVSSYENYQDWALANHYPQVKEPPVSSKAIRAAEEKS